MNRIYPDSMFFKVDEVETSPSVWKAQWIWHSGPKTNEMDEYAAYRKTFSLAKLPRKPIVRITASDYYCLWINGMLVEYGPALCDPRYKRYNVIPVGEYLAEGENCIAVLVLHGSHFQVPYPAAKGLLLQLEDGNDILLASNTSWKALPHAAYLMTHVCFDTVSFQEHFDARNFPNDWQMKGFDDSSWPFAAPVIPEKQTLWGCPQSQNRFFPWVNLIPQETAPAVRNVIEPVSMTAGEVVQRADFSFSDIAVRCSLDNVLPPQKCRILGKDKGWEVQNSDIHESEETFDGLHNAVLLFDFGRLVNARFGFTMNAPDGAIVEITYGEELEEGKVMSYSCSYIMYADAYITRAGEQWFTTYNWRHFRYVKLTFRNLSNPLELKSVWADETQYPFPKPQENDFDNPLLQKCLQATLNSLRLCVSDRAMDNPSRERKQYAGDGTGIVSAIDQVFGETALVKKYFHQFDESQHRTGLYRYSTCSDNDAESLLDHSLYLPVALYGHTMRFGDLVLVRRMMPGITSFLELIESLLESDGLARKVPYGLWFDWVDIGRKPVSFLLNAMCAKAFQCGAALERMMDNSWRRADDWDAFAKNIMATLHDKFYDEERRAYVDYLDDDGLANKPLSEHTNSLALLWEIADLTQSDQILAHYAAHHEDFATATPMWIYLPEALAHCDRTDLLLEFISRRFGPLFKAGRDAIPETWCRYGESTLGHWRCRNKRCITQGTGLPMPHTVVKEVAGIVPLAPGYKKVGIMPHPGELKHFSVGVKAPDGEYRLEYSRVEEKAIYHATFPCEKTGTFVLLSKVKPQLTFDGATVDMVFLHDSYGGKKAWGLEWTASAFEAEIPLDRRG